MLKQTPFVLTAVLIASALPASAVPARTFSTAYVSAQIPRGAAGRDAGVDVSQGRYVRITASGTLKSRSSVFTPGNSSGVVMAQGAGTLLGAFADYNGRLIGPWSPVGQFAVLNVPNGARRLLFRVNGMSGQELGAYHVVADVVSSMAPSALGSGASAGANAIHIGPGSAGTQSLAFRTGGVQVASNSIRLGGASTMSVGHGPNGNGVIPTGSATTRSNVQYALRRLGFSDTPANITNVMNTGVAAWVTAQLAAPPPQNDTSIVQGPGGNVEALPVLTGTSADGNNFANIEDRLFQYEVNTQWQLREKITLHWLDHFAVSESKVNQPGDMEHYIQTVRADALGNFAKLIADVSKEPAMLIWLDNQNNGYNPNVPPNENFGREVMQLYTLGLNTLNSDGTQVMDPNNPGNPLNTYQEQDVKSMALALTGFQLQPAQQVGSYPAYVDNVAFNVAAHAPSVNGGFSVMGTLIADGKTCPWSYTLYQQSGLNTACVVDNAAQVLANNPTTWVYESNELLERLVTETPSPAMVKRISTVWGQTVNDPNQIAKVIAAIAADPEFYNGKYSMVKEPEEYVVQAFRALGAQNSNPVSTTQTRPLNNGISDTARMNQEMWDPPSVFSFYYPGNKEMMINNAQLLQTWATAADISESAQIKPCPTCNTFLDFTAYATQKTAGGLGPYLLDALCDGGTAELDALVKNYLNNSPTQQNIQGALWIILTAPECGVN